jgi:hypothetical protein
MRILKQILFIIPLFFSICGYSQVSNYTFSQFNGTYTPITGGVNISNFTNWNNNQYLGTIPNTANGFWDENVSSTLLPIGFNFVYNGTTYTQFGVCTNGFISLGAIPTSSLFPLSTGTSNNIISAMGRDLIGRGSFLANRTNGSTIITINPGDINQISIGDKVSGTGIPNGATVISKTATTVTISAAATSNGTGFHFRFSNPNFGIRYQTIGVAPNRTLVVQFTGFQRYTTSGGFGELYNFQIRLNETTNVIDIVYSLQGPISTTSTTFEIGLRGNSNTDFNNRTTTTNWASTTTGSINSSTMTLTNTIRPTSGLTYTWTPPVPPVNDLVCNATTITCGGTLTGTTINSSNSGTGENGTCTISQSQGGVWYVVVGNGQTMTASLCGTMWDSKISVFSGINCSTLTCVGGNDDGGPACAGTSASFSFPTTIGTNYYILVHGYSTSSVFNIVLTCVTPCSTTPSTISVNLSNTVTNDVVTYTVTGGNGLVTGYQYSYDNFTTIAGTFTTTNNPWNLRLNTTNSTIWVRVVTQNGTCNSTTSNIVSTTIRCAQPSTYSTQYGDYITNVTFNTINNTTTSDPNNDGYQNFLNLSTTICKGQPYNISISGTNAGAFLGFQVWIDFNNNNDFSDAGESVFTSTPIGTANGTINIPSTASTGNIKMRVLGVYNTTPSTTPCGTTFYNYGEMEEYTLNITSFDLTTLSITGTLTICNGQSTILTGSGGGTYNWSNSSTNQSISVSPTTNTSYTLMVTNTNGCTATSSSNVQVKPIPNIPTLNPDTTICPSDFAVLIGSSNIGTIQWYDASTSGTLLGTGSSYTTPLLLNNTPFYAEAESNGCISSRAIVNVNVDPDCILPIYLSTFDGHNEGRENHLYWLTDQEINSSHFEVERSNNGYDFVKIGIVETDPTQSYNFIDNTPYSGSNYYRLKMVDLDETFSHSSIIYLETQNKIESKVYPNPFEDSLIYTYQSEQNEELEIQVINILGQKVFQYNVNCQTCGNYVTINTSNIPSGKYTIRIKHLTSLHETIQTMIKK